MLVIAGGFSALAALIHIGCIYFGAPWYRFFGAGESMASMSEQGRLQPTLITLAIIAVLTLWSLYALSAAGVLRQLPYARSVLLIISAIYLLRGIAGFFLLNNPIGRTTEFWVWSSSICLVIALFHIIGLKQTWSSL